MNIFGVLVTSLAGTCFTAATRDVIYQQVSRRTPSTQVELFGDSWCKDHGPMTKFHNESTTLPGSQERQNLSYPWTSQPVCSGEFSSEDEALCVFTSLQYNEGQGISIITTLKIATALAKDSILFPNLSAIPHSELQRVVQDDSMAGKGLKSKVSVWPGEQILSDKPSLLMHPAFMTNISWIEKEELLRVAISQLPRETQREILNLSTSPDQIKFFLAELICGHAGFQVAIEGEKHFLVFTKGSLVNHSCAPNSFFRVDQSTLTLNMVAARKIDINEEVTMSYSVNILPDTHFEQFEQRQRYLEKKFSFRCQCKRCQLGTRTDRPLLELLHRQKHLEVHPNLQDAYKLIELYRKIGMDIVLDVPYNFVSRMYKALGKTVEAEIWAERSAKIRMLSDTRAPSSIPIFNGD